MHVEFNLIDIYKSILIEMYLLYYWWKAWILAAHRYHFRWRSWITLLLLIQTFTDRRFSKTFHSKLRKLVQPSLCDGGSTLHRQIERVKERIVNIKNGSLSNLVNCIVYSLDHILLLRLFNFKCQEWILDLFEHSDDLLSRGLEQMSIVECLNLLLSRHSQLIFEQLSHVPVTYVFLGTLPYLDTDHRLVVSCIHRNCS